MILLCVFISRVLRGHDGYSGEHSTVHAFQVKLCLLLWPLPGLLVYIDWHAFFICIQLAVIL
jgi:hypothetical protein